MKFALYTFGSGARTYMEQVDHAIRFGCTAIEPLVNLDFKDLNLDNAKRVREYMDAVDMKIPCFSFFIQFQEDPKAGIERIKKVIDMGKILGAPYIHHTVGKAAYEGQPFREYLKIAVDVIRETSAYAEQNGMQLLIEPQGHVMNGVKHLSALFDTVKAPIGALLDTGNILESGDSVEKYIKAFGPLIRHVHIKDMLIRKKPPICPDDRYWSKVGNTKGMIRQTVVGTGDIDFIRVLKMLKALGYNGWYSLEYDAPEAFDIYYPRSMKNFAAMHEQIFGADNN